MLKIDVSDLDHKTINEKLRASPTEVELFGCCGQRFIAAGFSEHRITINGIPGNALGAYLNGASITVRGNAQDAVGDTMNDGRIVIDGNIGDAAGYAMRGGLLCIRGDAGYRAGIHMKEYKNKRPVIVIGGRCGSFLGEYQAGGILLVLGLTKKDKPIVGDFPFTGMHGGKVFLRTDKDIPDLPKNVKASPADANDLLIIEPYITGFCKEFGYDKQTVLNSPFT